MQARRKSVLAIVVAAGALVALPSMAQGAAVVRSAIGRERGGDPVDRRPATGPTSARSTRTTASRSPTGGARSTGTASRTASATPNAFSPQFFNAVSPRGVVFSTPGTGFLVSATIASGVTVEFGNIDGAYDDKFATFSPQRLFTPIGSTVTDVDFRIPGTNRAATTRGFGAVFTDVDSATSSKIEYFDVNGVSLGSFPVPATPAARADPLVRRGQLQRRRARRPRAPDHLGRHQHRGR